MYGLPCNIYGKPYNCNVNPTAEEGPGGGDQGSFGRKIFNEQCAAGRASGNRLIR